MVWSLIAVGVAGLFAMSLLATVPELSLSYSDLEHLIRASGTPADGEPQPLRSVKIEDPSAGSDHMARYGQLSDVVIGAYSVSGTVSEMPEENAEEHEQAGETPASRSGIPGPLSRSGIMPATAHRPAPRVQVMGCISPTYQVARP